MQNDPKTQGNSTTFNVYKLDAYEWWAGPSLEACLAEARAVCGSECYDDESEWFGPLNAEAMQTVIVDPDEGTQRTIAEELDLALDEPSFNGRPFLIAATE